MHSRDLPNTYQHLASAALAAARTIELTARRRRRGANSSPARLVRATGYASRVRRRRGMSPAAPHERLIGICIGGDA